MGWEEKMRWLELLRNIVDDAGLSAGQNTDCEFGAWDFAAAAA